MKAQKQKNLNEGTEDLEKLVAWDFKVQPFSDIHFRINDRLDVWPSTKRFYDLLNKRKGSYDNLLKFVKKNYTPVRWG